MTLLTQYTSLNLQVLLTSEVTLEVTELCRRKAHNNKNAAQSLLPIKFLKFYSAASWTIPRSTVSPFSLSRQLHFVHCTFRLKFRADASLFNGRVNNCPRKNVLNLGPSSTYHDQNYPDLLSVHWTKYNCPSLRMSSILVFPSRSGHQPRLSAGIIIIYNYFAGKFNFSD